MSYVNRAGVPATISPFDVLLVEPVLFVDKAQQKKNVFTHGNEIPLSILYLSSFLDRTGVRNDILDMRVLANPWKELERRLLKFQPRLVGITAFSSEILGAHKVAQLVKQYDSSIATVIGGIHASATPVETLRDFPFFDFLVYGEGEVTLMELVKALTQGCKPSAILGMAWRNGNSVVLNPPRPFVANLDEFPPPNRSRVDLRRYVPSVLTNNYLTLPTTAIIASRGCPFGCYHCSKGVWGRTVRYRSVQNIFDEILECVERHEIRDFRFCDDVLTLPQGPIRELCQLILDSRLKISFNCYSRIDHIKPDLLRLMKQAGCYHVKYGIEFGTQKALDLSNRRTTMDQARRAVKMTKEAGILVKGNFMMGIPGEVEEDFEKTIDFALELSPDLVSFGLFCLFPGSKFFNDAITRRQEEISFVILPKERVLPYIGKAYRRFYFRPAYVAQRFMFVVRQPKIILQETRRLFLGCLTLLWFFLRRLVGRA